MRPSRAETGQKSFEFWLMPVDEGFPGGEIFHLGSSTAGYDYSIYWQDGQIGSAIYTARRHRTSGRHVRHRHRPG